MNKIFITLSLILLYFFSVVFAIGEDRTEESIGFHSSLLSGEIVKFIDSGCKNVTTLLTGSDHTYEKCVRDVMGVASAESSLFKRGSWNNYFGLMRCGPKTGCSLRRYDTVQVGIEDWLALYVRNNRYKNQTPQARLERNYCASECKHWVKNFNGIQYSITFL